jgi:hypothetical protein
MFLIVSQLIKLSPFPSLRGGYVPVHFIFHSNIQNNQSRNLLNYYSTRPSQVTTGANHVRKECLTPSKLYSMLSPLIPSYPTSLSPPPPQLLTFPPLHRARICRSFKETRYRFSAWRAGTKPYLSYWPARLHRLAKSIPRNRFLGSINVYKYGLLVTKCTPASLFLLQKNRMFFSCVMSFRSKKTALRPALPPV